MTRGAKGDPLGRHLGVRHLGVVRRQEGRKVDQRRRVCRLPCKGADGHLSPGGTVLSSSQEGPVPCHPREGCTPIFSANTWYGTSDPENHPHPRHLQSLVGALPWAPAAASSRQGGSPWRPPSGGPSLRVLDPGGLLREPPSLSSPLPAPSAVKPAPTTCMPRASPCARVCSVPRTRGGHHAAPAPRWRCALDPFLKRTEQGALGACRNRTSTTPPPVEPFGKGSAAPGRSLNGHPSTAVWVPNPTSSSGSPAGPRRACRCTACARRACP